MLVFSFCFLGCCALGGFVHSADGQRRVRHGAVRHAQERRRSRCVFCSSLSFVPWPFHWPFVAISVRFVTRVHLSVLTPPSAAAGFVDGLKLGNNSKAAIIRIGLSEMRDLSKALYPSVKGSNPPRLNALLC